MLQNGVLTWVIVKRWWGRPCVLAYVNQCVHLILSHGGRGHTALLVCDNIDMSTLVSFAGIAFSSHACEYAHVCVCRSECVSVSTCFWKSLYIKRWILPRAGPGPQGWHPAGLSGNPLGRQMLVHSRIRWPCPHLWLLIFCTLQRGKENFLFWIFLCFYFFSSF